MLPISMAGYFIHRPAPVVGLALLFASTAFAQQPLPWEVQIGAQLPMTPLYESRTAYAERKPGLTIAVLHYGNMEARVGTRVRLELLIQSARSRSGGAVMKQSRTDVGVGLDLAPRVLGFSGPGVRGRFYAGVDVMRSSGREGACVSDTEICGGPGALIDDGIHIRGRAGLFIRPESERAVVRVDLGYVVGTRYRLTQHDLVFRLGFGGGL
jgi:hypothetical protein